jgi:hypothetical protein
MVFSPQFSVRSFQSAVFSPQFSLRSFQSAVLSPQLSVYHEVTRACTSGSAVCRLPMEHRRFPGYRRFTCRRHGMLFPVRQKAVHSPLFYRSRWPFLTAAGMSPLAISFPGFKIERSLSSVYPEPVEGSKGSPQFSVLSWQSAVLSPQFSVYHEVTRTCTSGSAVCRLPMEHRRFPGYRRSTCRRHGMLFPVRQKTVRSSIEAVGHF